MTRAIAAPTRNSRNVVGNERAVHLFNFEVATIIVLKHISYGGVNGIVLSYSPLTKGALPSSAGGMFPSVLSSNTEKYTTPYRNKTESYPQG